MTTSPPEPEWYWKQYEPGQKWENRKPSGEHLAALRRGLSAEAGAVPAMWKFHRAPNPDSLAAIGQVSKAFIAEHHALALFGMHQQSKDRLMHDPNANFGNAVRALHTRYSESAVDNRMQAAATATTVKGVVLQLRTLIGQLRTIEQPINYTDLMWSLRLWDRPDRRSRTLRSWGAGYHAWAPPTEPTK
ncbi:type I-E CRISPR-associated protein Cse2/CasB [Streptomyces noursei]